MQSADGDEAAGAAHAALAAQGVHTLLLQFTDLHGVAKGKFIPLDKLTDVLRTGGGFAGPSIAGTGLPRTGERAEYWARGDATTLKVLPWMPGVARIVGDGFVAGEPFDACPRQVLKRAVARLAERGWRLEVGIEPEFFLLKRAANDGVRFVPADDEDQLDKPSYDLKSLPRQSGFLRDMHEALEQVGIDVQQLDHEDAHGQYEINFAHAEVLANADRLMLFKLAAHALAERRGLVFSMMPKPFANQPGSGMHMHVSLWHGNQLLFDGHAAQSMSTLARHFVAGMLEHADALCALAAPTVNSYKRLVVGESLSGTSWAPAYVAHGPNNRTALIRTLPGRFEWRLPDASANPYLALAGLIAAGLDGIDRELPLQPECADDLFALLSAEVQARGYRLLPQSLGEAVDRFARSALLRDALGATLQAEFTRLKRAEWADYCRHVSEWEHRRYATAF